MINRDGVELLDGGLENCKVYFGEEFVVGFEGV